ncbi:hypothetical protein [Caproiciproducens galactitolivorans]|uniref:Amino acid permease/ SLC12A domain-containing protein n=1 Tax=Caproiciproducens galactitolivorans TaxID=642589 RepID=A0ABT4BVM5_9FIRM|nr:hypothetical protein [Caproiciproducens galactitolivorans]MCY1714939.1 hypothetical protein [Caproiciproducens galactitolivorans]
MNKKFSKSHLIFMSLGNIIGSGLFLGSSTVLSLAGPAAILAYLLGGFIMALEVDLRRYPFRCACPVLLYS